MWRWSCQPSSWMRWWQRQQRDLGTLVGALAGNQVGQGVGAALLGAHVLVASLAVAVVAHHLVERNAHALAGVVVEVRGQPPGPVGILNQRRPAVRVLALALLSGGTGAHVVASHTGEHVHRIAAGHLQQSGLISMVGIRGNPGDHPGMTRSDLPGTQSLQSRGKLRCQRRGQRHLRGGLPSRHPQPLAHHRSSASPAVAAVHLRRDLSQLPLHPAPLPPQLRHPLHQLGVTQ